MPLFIQCLCSFIHLCSALIQCIHSMHSFNASIQCIHSMHPFSAFIQCTHSVHSFIQYIHWMHPFNASIPCIHSVHSFNAFIHPMHSFIHSSIQCIHSFNASILWFIHSPHAVHMLNKCLFRHDQFHSCVISQQVLWLSVQITYWDETVPESRVFHGRVRSSRDSNHNTTHSAVRWYLVTAEWHLRHLYPCVKGWTWPLVTPHTRAHTPTYTVCSTRIYC